MESLYKIHLKRQEEMSVVPHAYQRRKLSLQTTNIILKEQDPLYALQQLSQNLPSYANLLSMTTTSFSPEFSTWSKIMKDVVNALNPIPFGFYINGVKIAIERPSFNVFELIKTIQNEISLLNVLKEKFG